MLVAGLYCFCALGQAGAQTTLNQMELPPEIRAWYRNPDGSCVQCSIGMCGVWQQCPAAYCLLWDTEYGPKVRGGSGPERVAGYSKSRQIPCFNVTGKVTWDWMRWAAKTGRYAAIGAGGNHYQTLYGLDDQGTSDPADDRWFVCNNNSTSRIDEYSAKGFQKLHLASGQWIVVLDLPPPAPVPRYLFR